MLAIILFSTGCLAGDTDWRSSSGGAGIGSLAVGHRDVSNGTLRLQSDGLPREAALAAGGREVTLEVDNPDRLTCAVAVVPGDAQALTDGLFHLQPGEPFASAGITFASDSLTRAFDTGVVRVSWLCIPGARVTLRVGSGGPEEALVGERSERVTLNSVPVDVRTEGRSPLLRDIHASATQRLVNGRVLALAVDGVEQGPPRAYVGAKRIDVLSFLKDGESVAPEAERLEFGAAAVTRGVQFALVESGPRDRGETRLVREYASTSAGVREDTWSLYLFTAALD